VGEGVDVSEGRGSGLAGGLLQGARLVGSRLVDGRGLGFRSALPKVVVAAIIFESGGKGIATFAASSLDAETTEMLLDIVCGHIRLPRVLLGWGCGSGGGDEWATVGRQQHQVERVKYAVE
jgi:hypothetical protein